MEVEDEDFRHKNRPKRVEFQEEEKHGIIGKLKEDMSYLEKCKFTGRIGPEVTKL